MVMAELFSLVLYILSLIILHDIFGMSAFCVAIQIIRS